MSQNEASPRQPYKLHGNVSSLGQKNSQWKPKDVTNKWRIIEINRVWNEVNQTARCTWINRPDEQVEIHHNCVGFAVHGKMQHTFPIFVFQHNGKIFKGFKTDAPNNAVLGRKAVKDGLSHDNIESKCAFLSTIFN